MARPVLVPSRRRSAAQPCRLPFGIPSGRSGERWACRRLERLRAAGLIAAGLLTYAWLRGSSSALARRSWEVWRSRWRRTGSSRPRPAICWRRSRRCCRCRCGRSACLPGRAGGSCRPRWRSPPSRRPARCGARRRAVLPAYVLVRTRATWPVVAAVVGVLLAAAAGVLVWLATIDGSIGEGGERSPGRALLRGLARLRRAPRPPRVGELRLPGLADAARRHRGARPAHPLALVRAGRRARRGDPRARGAGARHYDAHLRSRALCRLAASLPPRSGATDADRLSRHRRARRLRGRRASSKLQVVAKSKGRLSGRRAHWR